MVKSPRSPSLQAGEVHIERIAHRTTEGTLQQIKAELAKRPHVPNKREARQIRQERARGSR